MIYPYIMYGMWIGDMCLTLYSSILIRDTDDELTELNPLFNFLFKKYSMKTGGILSIYIGFMSLTFIILLSTYTNCIHELFLIYLGIYIAVYMAHIHNLKEILKTQKSKKKKNKHQ